MLTKSSKVQLLKQEIGFYFLWSKHQILSYINFRANQVLDKVWLSMVESFVGEKFEEPKENKS